MTDERQEEVKGAHPIHELSEIISDVRSDIALHCPKKTLRIYDQSITQIREWEEEMFDTYSISPINRRFWQRPYTVLGAISWFMSGAIVAVVSAIIFLIS